MVLRRWLITVLLLLPQLAVSQVETAIEQWVEETDDTWAAAEMSDQWLELRQHPVNINDTHSHERLFFLTPFQRQALCNYLILYGQMLSLKELRFVPGFDSLTVRWMHEVAVARPYTPSRRLRLADGHHQLVTAVGGAVEEAAGYRDSTYAGDRLHALLCYNYSLAGKVDLRLVADKDPGEQWGHGNFVGYHLMVNNVGPLERAIVGRYNLQFGQGLTLWTGLRPFGLLGTAPMRFGHGIRPAVTFYEEGYQEGLAARVGLGRGVSLSAFGAHGGGILLYGAHADLRRGNLVAGATVAHTVADSLLMPRDYVYNQHAFRGKRLLNLGVDAMWRYGNLTLFGEVSLDGQGAPAAIGGLSLLTGGANRLNVTGRYYHPRYQNLHSQPYTLGNGQGERGVTLDAQTALPLGMTLVASLDVHRFEVLRYADYSPSTGEWLRLQLRKEWGSRFNATLRYVYRLKERNIPNLDTTLYLGEQTVRRQLQGEVRAVWGSWTWTGKVVSTRFDSENGEPQRGTLASLAARYSRRQWQATAALAWFDVEGYYARIYFSESNLQYAWSMPVLNGQGLRGHVVVRYAVGQGLTIAAKYAVTAMPGEESIGTGAARTEGPLRQSWMVQLRCRF